jgi:uncharacterized membrane protein YkoI
MRTMTKFIIAGTAVLATAGGGAAYAATQDPTPTTSTTTSATTATTATTAPATSTAAAPKITAEQAIDAAKAKVPGARLVGLDLEDDRDQPATWQVELQDATLEHEVDVDAATGAVLTHESGKPDTDEDDD